MKLIVVGCGRMGSELALLFMREGHSVSVVDHDPGAFTHLGSRWPGQTVAGVAFDRDVLIKAGIETADGLAALTSSDSANIMTARIARLIYHVPQVVARLYEPRRAEAYRRLGLQTISSTAWGVGRIAQLLTHGRLDQVLDLGSGEVSVVEFEIGPGLTGRKVADVNVSTEIKVLSITRGGQAFIPSAQTPFAYGDLVHAAVMRDKLGQLESFVER